MALLSLGDRGGGSAERWACLCSLAIQTLVLQAWWVYPRENSAQHVLPRTSLQDEPGCVPITGMRGRACDSLCTAVDRFCCCPGMRPRLAMEAQPTRLLTSSPSTRIGAGRLAASYPRCIHVPETLVCQSTGSSQRLYLLAFEELFNGKHAP